MELNLGTKVVTLIDKRIEERGNVTIDLPKGLVGYICDTEYLKDGIVMIQFFQKEITDRGTGVYSYKIDEIKSCI